MACNKQHLLLFTRYPEPGSTKTRLIPELGAEGAAKIHKKLTEHIFARCLGLSASQDITLTVYYCGGDAQLFRRWLGTTACYRQQPQGDIGRRMQHAFRQAFAEEGERIVLIGSDVPGITVDILQRAFTLLTEHDAVIGPAADGGYYLIGLQRCRQEELLPHLFTDVPWSTARVFDTTMNILRQCRATVARLPVLRDIDRPEDLEEAAGWITL